MKVAEGKYQVRAAAYVLGCTPDLIYSYFKDRKEPVSGGLTEAQLLRIKKHVESLAHKSLFGGHKSEIAKVKSFFAIHAGQEQMQEIAEA